MVGRMKLKHFGQLSKEKGNQDLWFFFQPDFGPQEIRNKLKYLSNNLRTRPTDRLAVILAENFVFRRRSVVDFADIHKLAQVFDPVC